MLEAVSSPDETPDVYTRVFDARADQVGAARRFVGDVLAGNPRCEDAMTIVSELFTNAIQHTRSRVDGGKVEVEVIVMTMASTVLIYVTDGGSDVSVPHIEHPAATQSGGRGLHIVGELTSRWGYHATGGHGRTWAELEYAS